MRQAVGKERKGISGDLKMYLVYLDESGQSGANLNDPKQPVFVLAALVVPEASWLGVEQDLTGLLNSFFPDRPENLEIHAAALRNGNGYLRSQPLGKRLEFRDACLNAASLRGLKLVYRAIEKRRFKAWVEASFGVGVAINPHIVAFPLVARVVDEYLSAQPGEPQGIFISDENHEITRDVEKSIRLLRGSDGNLKLNRIIEKGFFIDSTKSLVLQLCDLCAYSARKKEEIQAGGQARDVDKRGIELLDPLIHRGNEAFEDTLDWWIKEQKKAARG